MADVFDRKDAGEAAQAKKTARRRELVARLCANADFREWLYGELDNMCAFDGVTATLTEFGMGVRATAAEIVARLLISSDAVRMLGAFAQRSFESRHEGIAASLKTTQTTGGADR